MGKADMAIDTTRASRDGHQYHEAWVMRKSLGLLTKAKNLSSIAIEGLSVEDGKGATAAATEIADATLYYGGGRAIKSALAVEVAQFKYSVDDTKPFRASDAKKTIEKFSKSEIDFIKTHGVAVVQRKIKYLLITNRPIYKPLGVAVTAGSQGRIPKEADAKVQYEQLRQFSGLNAKSFKAFCSRLSLIGETGAIGRIESEGRSEITNLSASSDTIVRGRFGDLAALIRRKAGSAGQKNNLIEAVDVLGALGINEERDLLPTPDAFVDPGPIIARSQLSEFVDAIGQKGQWLVRAGGGVGKTVFVQSLAAKLQRTDEVVTFDCFGGGAYRSMADGRHLPQRGLMHLVNELACRGLCDPILPGSDDPAEVIRSSIRRFEQVTTFLQTQRPARRLVIIIDAADNAGWEAERRDETSFPRELVSAMASRGGMKGLILILTARPEREKTAIGDTVCSKISLKPFSLDETTSFIKARRPDATTAQIAAIHLRADGNARVVSNLIEHDRELNQKEKSKVDLDTLLNAKIDNAIHQTQTKGVDAAAIQAFLCALANLPPPAPASELAKAFGVETSEIESFVSDLSPLLDRTSLGIIFRDEPTESLVQSIYGSQVSLLSEVVVRLTSAQSESVYAARALPILLHAMRDVVRLRALAFDTRFPAQLTSDVAKRAIRRNRLITALAAAAAEDNFNALVELAVELSVVESTDQRGLSFLRKNSDLVPSLSDPEALRRLFEAKSGWPGRRNNTLAICFVADGNLAEAFDHAKRGHDWLSWYYDQEEEKQRRFKLELEDYVSTPLYLIAAGKYENAVRFLNNWNPHYAYKIASRVIEILRTSFSLGKNPHFRNQLNALSLTKAENAALLCAINQVNLVSGEVSAGLTKRLATCLRSSKSLQANLYDATTDDRYDLALLRTAILAGSMGLRREAKEIRKYVRVERFGLWAFGEAHYVKNVLPRVLDVIADCLAEGREPDLFDCLPHEVWNLVATSRVRADTDGRKEIIIQKLKELPTEAEAEKLGVKAPLSNSEKRRAEEGLTSHAIPLLQLVRFWYDLSKQKSTKNKQRAFAEMRDQWAKYYSKTDEYSPRDEKRYFDSLYNTVALQGVTALGLTNSYYSNAILKWAEATRYLPTSIATEYVVQFSVDPKSHANVGRLAGLILKGIEANDDTAARTDEYADLARALIPANTTEASQLFTRALSELDAIGSGDYELTNEILSFAARMRAGPIANEAAFQLAKICELNNYDSDKFPWPLAGKAFARAWGNSYLAQLTRWHDREKTSLELALPSTLMFLMELGHLEPTDAVGLLSLVDTVELWDWDWGNVFDSIVKVDPPNKLALFESSIDLMKRGAIYAPRSTSLEKIEKYVAEIDKNLSTDVTALLKRRYFLEEFRKLSDKAKSDRDRGFLHRKTQSKEWKRVAPSVTKVDPLSKESMEHMIDSLSSQKDKFEERSQTFSRLRKRVAYRDRAAHMRAVSEMRNVPMSVKTALISNMSSEWSESSPTWRDQLRGIGVQMVRQHADSLMLREWGFSHDLNDLSRETGDPLWLLAKELVSAAASRRLSAGQSGWLFLASLIAEKADVDVPGKALERLLDSGVARFVDKVGDGKWDDCYATNGDSVSVAAGLIWHGLGQPDAVERWKAAHTVRYFAKLGRWEVIDALFGYLSGGKTEGYSAKGIKFFELYAKQWFLLSVARIAIDFPQKIRKHKGILSAILFDKKFPHISIQAIARKALICALNSSDDRDDIQLLSHVSSSLTSPYPRIVSDDYVSHNYWDRPKGAKEKIDFSIEYDFGQYELPKLGRLFGVPAWQVADNVAEWAKSLDPEITSMYDEGGREGRRRAFRNEDPKVDSYGTYLGKQAICLAAGAFLADKPISGRTYEDDPLKELLDDFNVTRPDGLWLSDGTGGYPEYTASPLLKYEANKDPFPTTARAEILSLAGLHQGSLTKRVRVFGGWKTDEGVSVSISSALVEPRLATKAGVALVTGVENQIWLPVLRSYDEGDARRGGERDMYPLEPWVTTSDVELKIDEYDPYGVKSATARPRLSREIIDAFSLSPTDVWLEEWRLGSNVAFSALAWGAMRGRGRHAEWDDGDVVECGRTFLKKVLNTRDRSLVVLVTLQKYIEHPVHEKSRDYGGIFKYSHAAAIIDQQLCVRIVSPKRAQLEAVKALSKQQRFEFSARYEVV